eukprot:gene9355-10380_t
MKAIQLSISLLLAVHFLQGCCRFQGQTEFSFGNTLSGAAYNVPVPSPAHLAFHNDTFGVIIHFNFQTFLDPSQRSLSKATLDPSLFKPSNENFTEDWMAIAQEMGARYAVYVADHFSGFSTWPSAGLHPP